MQPWGLAGAIKRPWGAHGSSWDAARAAQLAGAIGRLRESRGSGRREAARARGWIVWPRGLTGLIGLPQEQLGIDMSERE